MPTAILNSKFQIVDVRPVPRGIGDEIEISKEDYAVLSTNDLNTPDGYPRFMFDSMAKAIVEAPKEDKSK